MKTIVTIEWNHPEEQDWLCPDNIKIALSEHCRGTKFEVSDVKELSGSEAIFGFCGWLTTQEEETVMSEKHDCATIASKVKLFCDTNKLEDPRDNWTDYLTHPK